MKVKNKILIAMVFGFILSGLIIPNKANAALQSNGGTPATRKLNDWMLQIRQMQELGGTLGRTDTIDTTNLTSSATDLDIHMEKNTEYGAMAILSASAYGNPNKINDGETTTGNSTGIVIKLNKEWVAASTLNLPSGVFTKSSNRYKNIYEKTYKEKIGDGILNWHGFTSGQWINRETSGLLRSYSVSIFSYNGYGGNAGYNENNSVASYPTQHVSRACIVVGTGL